MPIILNDLLLRKTHTYINSKMTAQMLALTPRTTIILGGNNNHYFYFYSMHMVKYLKWRSHMTLCVRVLKCNTETK